MSADNPTNKHTFSVPAHVHVHASASRLATGAWEGVQGREHGHAQLFIQTNFVADREYSMVHE